MIADKKYSLKECYRIIWQDMLCVRKYQEGTFDFIFDIGAHIGVFSTFMRMRHPDAKMIAVEPCKETRGYLCQNLNGLVVQVDERALGNGRPLYFFPRGRSYSHRFVEHPTEHYQVQSVKLVDLFNEFGCQLSNSYLLKIDCEGGEKYIVGDWESEEVLANANHISIEVHFGIFEDQLTYAQYDKWIRTRFRKTHSIGYHFSSRKVGCGNYILEKLGGR